MPLASTRWWELCGLRLMSLVIVCCMGTGSTLLIGVSKDPYASDQDQAVNQRLVLPRLIMLYHALLFSPAAAEAMPCKRSIVHQ